MVQDTGSGSDCLNPSSNTSKVEPSPSPAPFNCLPCLRPVFQGTDQDPEQLPTLCSTMADPLSITASVAGIISLGVQVVSGITQYLDAVRERKDDVASARTQILRMQELLQHVEKLARKVEPTHQTTAAFLKASAAIEPELKSLEEFVRKVDTKTTQSPSHDVLGKVSLQAQKLTYPFHRPTMDRLRSDLVRVNEMLQAALQLSVL